MDAESEQTCTFCGKRQSQVRHLIVGPGANICNECVDVCLDILQAHDSASARLSGMDQGARPAASVPRKTFDELAHKSGQRAPFELPDPLPKPKEIVTFLDRYVIGQERAKRTLAVALYNHCKVIAARRDHQSVSSIQKSNVLLIGPTGTGKTYLARTLARVMHVPFVVIDATALTASGYVGDDVESILQRLLQAADNDVAAAQHGIVCIDEIDKLARPPMQSRLAVRDISGESVQQALLKIIESGIVTLSVHGRQSSTVQFDTSGVLFIGAGSFEGLPSIIERRQTSSAAGFSTRRQEEALRTDTREITPDDLVNYGFSREFVGRLPVIATLDPLNQGMLARIIAEPENSLLAQYSALFELDEAQLHVTKAAIDRLADIALRRGTGARGLRALFEEVLQAPMFELPGIAGTKKVTVDIADSLPDSLPTVTIARCEEQ